MTQQEWFDCKDLNKLFDQVTSDRKKQLFALACCRSIEHLMLDQSKNCLAKLELFIDGKIDKREFEVARQLAWSTNVAVDYAAWVVAKAVNGVAARAANAAKGSATYWAANTAHAAIDAIKAVGIGTWVTNAAKERIKQIELLRDIYNPFLLDLKFSQQAVSLAEQVYEGEDKARGVLSDYLEEQSYPAEVVLHLKSGFHPKGCWLIDQILGK